MRSLRWLSAAIVAFALTRGLSYADGNTGIVNVHVVDAKTGKSVSGWTVQVTARDGDTQRITGPSGLVNFLTVTPGIARIDVLQKGALGACPAVITVSANETTLVNVHVQRAKGQTMGCSPHHAQTLVRPGVTTDVYDIY